MHAANNSIADAIVGGLYSIQTDVRKFYEEHQVMRSARLTDTVLWHRLPMMVMVMTMAVFGDSILMATVMEI